MEDTNHSDGVSELKVRNHGLFRLAAAIVSAALASCMVTLGPATEATPGHIQQARPVDRGPMIAIGSGCRCP
jgi:hypothetical protein